jgi:hypothetical protein
MHKKRWDKYVHSKDEGRWPRIAGNYERRERRMRGRKKIRQDEDFGAGTSFKLPNP